MDGSTDSRMRCFSFSGVHTNMSFFAISRFKQVNVQGLFDCFVDSLSRIGITGIDVEQCKKLIGISTDGTSANIAAAGLKGKEIPWLLLKLVLSTPFGISCQRCSEGHFL